MSTNSRIVLPDLRGSMMVGEVVLNYGVDGIMYGYVSDEPEDQVASQKLVNAAIIELTEGKKVPLLIEYNGIILPNVEAREYWASEENSQSTLADAFVMKSLPMKLIGNFYLNFNKPAKPTRIFNNGEQARLWLKTFL